MFKKRLKSVQTPFVIVLAEILVYAYCVLVGIFVLAWIKTSSAWWFRLRSTTESVKKLSVIIVCRNELQNLPFLLEDLANQTLARKFWEVIFVDDDSEDGSYEWLLEQKERVGFNLKVLRNPDFSEIISPKKRGITEAIKQAEGEWLVCTDADCRVPATWLETIFEASHSEVDFISMPVRFMPVPTWFEQWQAVEFASLVGSGAACIALGVPTMCNGANIAYRKQAFEQVGGFSGSEHIASGDDEFLMHKIANQSTKRVRFLKKSSVIVSTRANPTWQSLLSQRLRWASKWENYQNPFAKILAVFVFLVNVSTIFLYLYQDFLPIALRFLVEFLFLSSILFFFRQKNLIFWMPFVFVVYPLYVVFFAIFARKKSFVWKKRTYNETKQ
jgi:cellulose synthase/poly-beta-1,6-N-acetylglucosamine synthase-like glycosyltransferase